MKECVFAQWLNYNQLKETGICDVPHFAKFCFDLNPLWFHHTMYSSLSQLPILFTILNGIVCLLGDELVRWNANSLLSRAICDNVTHALNGMLCAVIITLRANVQLSSNARFILILCGALVSSCIDLDHFIMARSLTLQVNIYALGNHFQFFPRNS